MDNKNVGSYRKMFLLVTVVVLIVLSCKPRVPPEPSKIKEAPPPVTKDVTVKEVKVVFDSTLSGKWYPADANTLNKQLGALFQKIDVKPADNIIALILPHAGYQFSGKTAAAGLQTLGKKYKRIIIIGPSHYVSMENVLSVPQATHYQNPLGEVPLDVEFINKLLAWPQFSNFPQANQYEHSTQIQVPLLQHVQRDFKLVPIVAGRCSPQTISEVAAILKNLIDSDTLVIASSDFVHYGPNYDYVPFTENVPEQIKKLDMGAYDYIAKLDSSGFLKYRSDTGATICGYVPIAILLSMLDESAQTRLVKYATSGEITGDFSNSVSYFAIAFSGSWEKSAPLKPQAESSELTAEDKKQLLAIARKSIVYFFEKQQIPEISDLNITISDTLKNNRAAFVTLNKVVSTDMPGPQRNRRLRGCVGELYPRQPLCRSVITNAINAAFNDTRFYPLTKNELSDIEMEISVLTIPKSINSPKEIKIGTDGVILSKDGYSAVFLPQVAPEQRWDVNEMLTNLSLKAGLPKNAWKDGANFHVFQAVVFGENEK
jgi:MEMO1 family protein